ncbi:MAG TPA: Panacea domain-containing protein [Blastocatellia bacterium]|nr:Panacea domain-containing protein [Blastocatellia bacterium]
MRRSCQFDPEKALETVLYIARKAPKPTTYRVLKILYFADKLHLQRFGRQICGDDYFALRSGPVPSQTYDMIKDVTDGRTSLFSTHACNSFEVDKHSNRITPLREPDTDLFSKSDIGCIEQSIAENGMLSFPQLREKSHDAAYQSADENDVIPLRQIIATLPNAELLRDYLECE